MTLSPREIVEAPAREWRCYPEYKDSGFGWLGEVPGHWDVKPLKYTVTACQNGLWGEEPTGGADDLVCVRVADFDRSRNRVADTKLTIRAVPVNQRDGKLLKAGDLLLEKSGGGDRQPVGTVVLYDLDVPAVCSNFVARMPVAEGYDPSFLLYLHAALYSGRINTRSIKQNTGIQNLDSNSYLDEKVGLPPQQEQRAISAFLNRETEKIDDLIAKRERLIGLLQEKKTALISRAVTKGLDPDVPMKDSGVEWLGEIPEHWALTALRRFLVNIEQGWSPNAEDRVASPKEWGVIKLSAINKGVFRSEEAKTLPQDVVPDLRYEIQAGDILLTRGNTPSLVGDVCVVGNTRPRLMLSDLVYRLCIEHQKVNRVYLAYWLLSRAGRYQITRDARGSSQSMVKVSQEHIRSWSVALPPLAEQQAIVTFVERETTKIDALVGKVREHIDRLREYRTALISAAATGKIDVRAEVPNSKGKL